MEEKLRPLGNRPNIVATNPAWAYLVVNTDELDINPPGGPNFRPHEWKTRERSAGAVRGQPQKRREVLPGTTKGRPAQHEMAHVSPEQADEQAATLCRDPRWRAQPHGAASWTNEWYTCAHVVQRRPMPESVISRMDTRTEVYTISIQED
jgi:hypothetical protein